MNNKITVSVLGLFVITALLSSCSSSSQFASSFGKRKYTKGYYFDNASKQSIMASNKTEIQLKSAYAVIPGPGETPEGGKFRTVTRNTVASALVNKVIPSPSKALPSEMKAGTAAYNTSVSLRTENKTMPVSYISQKAMLAEDEHNEGGEHGRKISGLSVTGLILGILGLPLSLSGAGLAFGIAGIIFSIFGLLQCLRNHETFWGSGIAIAGIALSALAIIMFF
jgi:hypothetical protein